MRRALSSALDLVGLVVVAVGLALLAWPLAVVFVGALLLFASWRISRGGAA